MKAGNRKLRLVLAVCLAAWTMSNAAFAQDVAGDEETVDANVVVDVRITNISQGQIFSRAVVATHTGEFRLFRLGNPARPSLAHLAETGNPEPLATALEGVDAVRDVAVTPQRLGPGESVTVHLRGARRVSVAGMLVRTNDGFFGLNGTRIPLKRPVRVRFSPGYDAGSEFNDELCQSIPGPPCHGNGGVDEESVVLIHSGIHGIGDLQPSRYDWRNPVARIEIHRRVVDPETTDP